VTSEVCRTADLAATAAPVDDGDGWFGDCTDGWCPPCRVGCRRAAGPCPVAPRAGKPMRPTASTAIGRGGPPDRSMVRSARWPTICARRLH